MVHNQMDGMVIMNVLHVYSIPVIDTDVNEIVPLIPLCPSPSIKKEDPFIPWLKP